MVQPVMFALGRDLVGFVSQPKHLSFFTASPKLALAMKNQARMPPWTDVRLVPRATGANHETVEVLYVVAERSRARRQDFPGAGGYLFVLPHATRWCSGRRTD